MPSTISPNMNLIIPTVGTDPGPDWANNLNSSLSIIDGHDHTTGSGVPITPNAININSDLPFNSNDATLLRSARFATQNAPIAGVSPDLGCLYVSGVDLYYNDINGNQIRITQSASVAGSAGTITGLPSGTASAAFSAISGTFIFEQATATAANMDVGTVIVRYPGSYPSPAGNYISLQAPATLATGYAFTLPTNTPVSNNSFVASSSAGVLSYITADNSTLEVSGSVVQIKNLGVTKPKLAPLGQQVSASCGLWLGTGGGAVQAVTNLSVTITTTGRPVQISSLPDGTLGSGGGYTGSYIAGNGNNAYLMIYRNGVPICYISNPAFANGANQVNYIDIGQPAGTYTYELYSKSDPAAFGAFYINRVVLAAYEL